MRAAGARGGGIDEGGGGSFLNYVVSCRFLRRFHRLNRGGGCHRTLHM